MLQKENWNNVLELNESDVDGKSLEFIKTLTNHFNTAFPIKKFTISPKNNRSGNWITKWIINSCKRKRELYKLCQITNDTELKTYYKTYTSILKKVICQAKLNCNRDFIMKAGNKGKAIWKVVKRETGKKSDSMKMTIKLLTEDHIN